MSSKLTWWEQDNAVRRRAEYGLLSQGYHKEIWYGHTPRYIRGNEMLVLVRSLGKLNWHSRSLEQIRNNTPEILVRP